MVGMTKTVKPQTATCKRCRATLRSAASIARGRGDHCERMARKEAAVINAGYRLHQLDSARQLIEDEAIFLLPTGAYIGVSTDGADTYICTTETCTCAAYAEGRRCYHRAAATLLAA